MRRFKKLLAVCIGLISFCLLAFLVLVFLLPAVGIGFQYLGPNRDAKFLTFASTVTPPLDYDLLTIGDYPTFGKMGQVTVSPKIDTDFTIDEGNVPLMRISAKKGYKSFSTNDHKVFTPMEKTKTDDKGNIILGDEHTYSVPDVQFELINRDGSSIEAPYKDGKLYTLYGYKDNKWEAIPVENVVSLTDDERVKFDYLVVAAGAQVISIANYKIFRLDKALFYGFQQVFQWTLKLTINGISHDATFTTFKNPPDFVFYPMGKIYGY